MMSSDDIAAIRARVEKATPGPWKASHRHGYLTADDDESVGLGLEIEGPPEAWGRGQFERGADAQFIAHAREDVPRLLDALAASQARERALAEALAEAGDALTAVINYRDEDGTHPLDGPITIQVDRAISRSRAALANAGEDAR